MHIFIYAYVHAYIHTHIHTQSVPEKKLDMDKENENKQHADVELEARMLKFYLGSLSAPPVVSAAI